MGTRNPFAWVLVVALLSASPAAPSDEAAFQEDEDMASVETLIDRGAFRAFGDVDLRELRDRMKEHLKAL
ncbi:MAG: hypothetical protein ACYTCU_09630 [Planctomycetota bacterium]|jgi:hypothetical protein